MFYILLRSILFSEYMGFSKYEIKRFFILLSIFNLCWSHLCTLLFLSLIYLGYYLRTCKLSIYIFCVCLKRVCVLQQTTVGFHKCQWGQICQSWSSNSVHDCAKSLSEFFFALLAFYITERLLRAHLSLSLFSIC